MSYISAITRDNKVVVWERNEVGERVTRDWPAPYYFYYDDPDGQYTTIYGTKVSKYECDTGAEMYSAKKKFADKDIKLWESDIPPEMRLLSNRYYGKPAPKLNVTFFDIEVDYDPQIGFSSITNPYAPINSVALLHQWKKEIVVLVVPPEEGWDAERLARAVIDCAPDAPIPSEFTIRYEVCADEAELLLHFIREIRDADIICGWNSDFFDCPYVAQRIARTLDGQELDVSVSETVADNGRITFTFNNNPNPTIDRTCSFLCKLDFPTYGTVTFRPVTSQQGQILGVTVDMVGRIRLDYMALVKKYEPGERASFKLASVSEQVLVDDKTKEPLLPKLEYEGSLADLYRNNFPFFVRYNIRDTEILNGFENKLGYVDVANQMAHLSTALFSHITGTLKLAEYALINFCHHELKRVVKNTTDPEIDRAIDGALVLLPQVGLHERFGSIDVTSLYPTAIRSINISIETIRGQFKRDVKDFQIVSTGLLEQCTLVLESNGRDLTMSGAEWRDWLRERNWAVSGYGTVFDQTEQGFIPALLTAWFKERKRYQALKKDAIEAGDDQKAGYYDRLQYVYKIKLNSLYGALTNLYFRFYDLRMGESTTGTGRMVLKHQCRVVAQALEGNYDVDFPLYDTVKDAMESGYTEEEAKLVALDGPLFNGKRMSDSVIYGDSVAGDTVIETTNGSIKIEQLFENVDQTIGDKQYSNCVDVQALTYDRTLNQTYFGKVKYVMRHRTSKQMYRVWITNSQYIDVTEDHALIGYSNTRRRGKRGDIFREITPMELRQGGTLIYQQSLPYQERLNPALSTYPTALYELAGYVMGDGYVDVTSTGGVLLSVGSHDLDEVISKILVPIQQYDKKLLSSWTIKPNGHDVQISSTQLRVLLRAWLYCTGTKRTPAWMFTAPKHVQQAYLRGWFSADGWVNQNKTIGLTNVEEGNIADVRRLLMQCNVSSTWCIESTQNSFNGVLSGTYSKRLTVKTPETFAQTINFIQTRKQIDPAAYRSTRRKATQQYDFELVVPTKIEKLPLMERFVYDIEVDDTHVFFANNILVHNTDSTYFKTYADTIEDAIVIADAVAKKVNDSYEGFMQETFLCTPGFDNLVKAGREIVSDRGIFVEKKRYILHLVDLDGKKVDKMKVMGLDTKKTTLPAEVSAVLNKHIERFLKGESWESVSASIVEYKDELMNSTDPLRIGLPKGVKKIESYTAAFGEDFEARLPGHVAAAIYYNQCLKEYKDKISVPISSGMKIKVFYLIGKHGKFKSIALPTDIEVVPQWFLDNFRIDRAAHVERLVDNPLSNILKAIGKEPPSKQSMYTDSLLVFD